MAVGLSQATGRKSKEAGIAKRERVREAADKAASDKAKRTALWKKVAAKPAAEQQDSGSHANGEGQA